MKSHKFIIFFITLIVSIYCNPNCKITKITVNKALDGTGLSDSEVIQHIQDLGEIEFANPKEHHWSCVDGRETTGILGTPGGDIGEFIVALAVYNKYGGETNNGTIQELFKEFMENIGSGRAFYMHSDYHSLDRLKETVPIDDITNIPPENQELLKELLVEPQHIGCGHLKLMLTHPEDYEVPAEITKGMIQAFFDYLWNHENWEKLKLHYTNLTILNGEHTEKAVIQVIQKTEREECKMQVPLVTPLTNSNSIFVDHPISVYEYRYQLATLFYNKLPSQNITSVEEMKKDMDEIATKQLGITLSYLASGKPIYILEIEEDISQIDTTSSSSSSTSGTTTTTTTTTSGTNSGKDNMKKRAGGGPPAWLPVIIVLVIVTSIVGITYLIYFYYIGRYRVSVPSSKSNSDPESQKNNNNKDTIQLDDFHNIDSSSNGNVQLE